MNMLHLEGKKVLIQLEAAVSSNPTNIVIGEPRNKRFGSRNKEGQANS
jgi:hypothetical protein